MSDTPTPETDAFINRMFHDREHELTELYNFTMGLERELNEALAANAELLERLRERTESHLAASARDVQTIQRQAVMLDRLAAALRSIAWVEETGNRDFSLTGEIAFEALSAYAKRQP